MRRESRVLPRAKPPSMQISVADSSRIACVSTFVGTSLDFISGAPAFESTSFQAVLEEHHENESQLLFPVNARDPAVFSPEKPSGAGFVTAKCDIRKRAGFTGDVAKALYRVRQEAAVVPAQRLFGAARISLPCNTSSRHHS